MRNDNTKIGRAEAARYLGVDGQTITNYISRGMLSMYSVNGYSYIDRAELEAMKERFTHIKADEDAIRMYEQELHERRKYLTESVKMGGNRINDPLGMRKFGDIFCDLMRGPDLGNCLTEREKSCITAFFRDFSYKKIAEDEGLSRERVRSLVIKAARRMAHKEANKRELEQDNRALYNRIMGQHKYIKDLERKLCEYQKKYGIEDERRRGCRFSEEDRRIATLLSTGVRELDISIRLFNCLVCASCKTLGDVVSHEKADFIKYRNFGRKSLSELSDLVEGVGLKFGMDIEKYKNED